MTAVRPAADCPAPPAASVTVRGDRTLHWVLLGLSLGVLLLAAMLRTSRETQVVLPMVGWSLPELCFARRWFGLDCPGCGMTRSFIAIMHGDLVRAWQFNPAGLIVFGVVAFQVPYRALQLERLRRGFPDLNPVWLNWSWAVVGAALLIQWVARFLV